MDLSKFTFIELMKLEQQLQLEVFKRTWFIWIIVIVIIALIEIQKHYSWKRIKNKVHRKNNDNN